MKYYLKLSVLGVFLNFCSAYPDLKVDRPPAEVFSQGVYLSAQVKPEERLHSYVVELKWDENVRQSGNLVVRKFQENGLNLKNMSLQGTYSKMLDPEAREGETYRYELWSGENNIDTVVVGIPVDLDLTKEDLILESSTLNVGRLHLGVGRTLITNGYDINWNLFELVASPKSKIATFRNASGDGVGKPSGKLNLTVQKYEGFLEVDWRGQDGASGITGPNTIGRGEKGPRGQPGKYRPSHTSGGPDGREFEPGECLRHPTNGGRGQQGPRGGKGNVGFRGGVLEKINITIANSVDRQRPRLYAAPGNGGAGGKGGMGGLGGFGGDPGDPDRGCPKASSGPEGQRGERGLDGPQGLQGSISGPICLKVEGITLEGKCDIL